MTLHAERLSWSASGVLIVDGVSCTVPAGALVGLLGPNGSGKSSLLRLIARIRRPDAGDVSLGADDLASQRRRAIARRLAFVEQDAPIDVDLSVQDVVMLGRTPYRRALELDGPRDRELVADALHRTALDGFESRSWTTLSGGERQRARIARAVVQQPDLLLLDEPTNHLDIAHQLDVMQLIRGLGLTTLAALHDLNLAAMFCDSLIVLCAGRVVAAGPPADVLSTDLIRRVYGIESAIATHPATGTPVVTPLPPRGGSE